MSTKNIIKRETVGKNLHLTFETDGALHEYSYPPRSAAAIKRGVDPAELSGGRLVKVTKKKD